MSNKDLIVACYYCGLPATSIDHVVPQSLLKKIELSTIDFSDIYSRNRKLVVDSCMECNMLLSNTVTDTLAERKKILKQRLRKRYYRLFRMPVWTDEELNELEGMLRIDVENSIKQIKLIKLRLNW